MNARFPSSCPACRDRIEAGDPIARHGSTGQYVHPGCGGSPIAPRGGQTNTWGEPETFAVAGRPRAGIFTVVMQRGARRTVKVSDEQPDGTTFVSLLTGPDNERSYSCVGLIRDGRFRWTRKHSDPNEPLRTAVATVISCDAEGLGRLGRAYALESGKCYVCNRVLTTPESVEAGIGPVCAGSWAA